MTSHLMLGFRGDLHWLHERESHKGRPYWPSGESGVTLDPGMDVHHAEWELVERVLAPHLTADQLRRLKECRPLVGLEAKAACADPKRLRKDTKPNLRKWWGKVADIRISRELAAELLPQVADPYWRGLVRRFPDLLDAPPAVQTAMLSLGYNRGAWNRALAVLRPWIVAHDWPEVGREIRRMQQDHKLQNIRKRRVLEGDLILAAMGEQT